MQGALKVKRFRRHKLKTKTRPSEDCMISLLMWDDLTKFEEHSSIIILHILYMKNKILYLSCALAVFSNDIREEVSFHGMDIEAQEVRTDTLRLNQKP